MINITTPFEVISAIKGSKNAVKGLSKQIAPFMTGDSLYENSANTRIEPIVLVDESLRGQPELSDVLHTMTNLFASLYLSAASGLCQVNGVTVASQLSKLNPKRSPQDAIVNYIAALEDYDHKLPDFKDYVPGLESSTATKTQKEISGRVAGHGGRLNDDIRQNDNLITGKSFEVAVGIDGSDYNVRVNLRLIPVMGKPSYITELLSLGSNKNTLKERWHSMKAGEITFWSEFIFMNDLLTKHANALKNDTSGFYTEAIERNRKNATATLISGQPSLANTSNIVIMSAKTALAVEDALGGKLSRQDIRENAMRPTSIMQMVILDSNLERVTIYTKTSKLPIECSFRDLKNVNKSSGPDVMTIMEAFLKNDRVRL